jgi:hypothetical protein
LNTDTDNHGSLEGPVDFLSHPFFFFEDSVFTSKAFGPACMGGVLMVDFETGIYGFLFLLLGWTSMNDDSCAPARFENVGKLLMKIHSAASQGFIIMHAVSWTNFQKVIMRMFYLHCLPAAHVSLHQLRLNSFQAQYCTVLHSF